MLDPICLCQIASESDQFFEAIYEQTIWLKCNILKSVTQLPLAVLFFIIDVHFSENSKIKQKYKIVIFRSLSPSYCHVKTRS